MQKFLERFNELYRGKKSLDIELLEEPFSMKYARYNQSGEVCHCMSDSNTANVKMQNGWQSIQCDRAKCQYRQKNEQGKMSCNRIGWLKFLIPSICQDRIWLMRITGQTSLDRLNNYFKLQKLRSQPVKGHYTLFLKQEEQSNFMGKTFNNYVLDILKKEDFISEKTIPQTIKNPQKTNVNNVNNCIYKEHSTAITNNQQELTSVALNSETKNSKKKATKKSTRTTSTSQKKELNAKHKDTIKTLPDVPNNAENEATTSETSIDNYNNYYVLESTYKEKIQNKKGEEKEYLIGHFFDMEDKQIDIVINPKDEVELSECDLGTIVKLDIKDVAGRKFAIDLFYIDKHRKNIAA